MTTDDINYFEKVITYFEEAKDYDHKVSTGLMVASYGRELLEEIKRLRIVSGEEFHEGKIVTHQP